MPMFSDKPFELDDLRIVVTRISQQHKEELFLGGSDPIEVFDAIQRFIALGSATTIWSQGHPLAVLAVAKGRLWFIASDRYFKFPTSAIRHGRRLIKRLAAEHGPLVARTAALHPDLDRWMRLHGGELQESDLFSKLYIFR